MAADTGFLKTLQDKEAELQSQLESTSLYKQIMGIRSTIELFQNGQTQPNGKKIEIVGVVGTPQERVYQINGTWGAKIAFALDELTSGYVDDIMKIVERHEPGKYDAETLYKRISQNCSMLKADGKIDGVKNGTTVKYYKK